ncbi:Transcriptional regulatory protein ZraR [Pelotomaculum schinkii]|uniref:Transcriptional regulatory protein ZraR n=1 Tax=Pelotomaculum schinkii TaxID=78350 RepID=A0A4Y7R8E6_9FIRM|nr:sigma 54-interacting transcriptional regulator [Pelotomaculum schinkii]TEB05046.1 Transcriptional regulatory protein ZraR [Pelotomaculum schinkii]
MPGSTSKIENANLMLAALDASFCGIIVVDVDGQIVSVNEAAKRIFGQKEKDLLGCHIENVSRGMYLTKVLKTGVCVTGQRMYIGERCYISNHLPITYNGAIEGAVAVLQDITELQETTKELQSTRQVMKLLETVLDSDYECIVGVDTEAKITMLNQAYCKFLGVKQEEALGRNVQDVIENTRLHIVLQTGHPEIGQIQRINGHNAVCSRIPIKIDGKLVAAIGKVMFQDVSELRSLIKKVGQLQSELEYYKEEIKSYHETSYSLQDIAGNSCSMRDLKKLTLRVAKNNSTVLIRGESGTGKELIAHALHSSSPRSCGPFVKVNCAAMPEELLESELFGYQDGAFTGARKGGKLGKFELANKGTIFLDEIGDMPMNMQVKLLRVLQEKEVERLGGNRTIKIDVRIVAATNRNLEKMVQEHLFREDLFYRLNVVSLNIPPLRERPEDIPLLADAVMKKLIRRLNCCRKALDVSAIDCLTTYHWPGNVRELENVLERILNIVEDEIITEDHVAPYLPKHDMVRVSKDVRPLKEVVEQLEKDMILKALEKTKGNCITASNLLQVSKSTFYEKMSRYGIYKKFN